MKSLLVGDISSYRFHAYFDCEYTCWADSMETRWANPERPAELLQIGIAVYDTNNKTFTDYLSNCKPTKNPILSNYCIDLLKIDQDIINNAPNLSLICEQISLFLSNLYGNKLFLCSWGDDYSFMKNQRIINDSNDPFIGIPILDLQKECMRLFCKNIKNLNRDEFKIMKSLKTDEYRHNALADAYDLHYILKSIL